ncbi:MgtC/SapB family protein [uncultured Brevundimonas sp.]|uniref:MgtC/SapB family protein n=1 Tax=uncultured Brevundimonas sp. TaxID=213418 RepID=UPI0025FD5988|nr:MgtC/SapB family protein [uncultured Brevundimonas sp.]
MIEFARFADYAPPLIGAVLAGGLIGFEREWRGRAAGLRTHLLVALASCLLMLAAMSQGQWAFEALPDENIVTDPTRMAHGVLTGIGFLCAGVIFRTGFSIHGLTTAASLWITSALGLLFGAGMFGLGAAGTLVTVGVLTGLRLVSARLPPKTLVDAEVCWRRGATSPEPEIEQLFRDVDPTTRHNRFELIEQGRMIRRSWKLQAAREDQLKRLAEALCRMEGVTAYRFDPRDD